jgi:hypothetical protein
MFLLLRLCVLLVTLPLPDPKSPTRNPARCSYPTQPVAVRQLFQQIDQALPQVVAQLQQDSAYQKDLPYVEVNSCFRPFAITQLFVNPFVTTSQQVRMRRYLRRGYYKELGESPRPPVPQWATIDVLEYASAEAASATKQVLDSLVATCKGCNRQVEPWVVYESYRFTRVGACLVRFNLYNQDPYQRRSLRELVSRLPLELPRRTPTAAGHAQEPATKSRRN